MADRKESKSKAAIRKKVEAKDVKEKEKKEEKGKKKLEKVPDKPKPEEPKPAGKEETVEEGAQANAEDGELELEPIELPPFEIIVGERMDPFFFKFQFKNVEYSSGRNKTFLCFLVDTQGGATPIDVLRGYLEDEHSGGHAEEAFFQQVLPLYENSLQYAVTWYTSSSPCAACAAKIVEVLSARKTLRLAIFCSRLFQWEEPEIQAGLKALAGAGCKLRMMRPLDFNYIWDTFVENEEQSITLWEDCQENYEYYEEKLSSILH
ncbi:C-_U-editing enzyme APOBEC-2b [Denticeps clupeoides]|uniref:C->U-editing enzyme APOBEC-2b n=1 Tax=Denticeps clupeoides TaxID=299321 RepID=UPI0010A39B9B|nr:C->U-editing enzyme APOBEC-2-like [Denticeps clupeoides]XP_028848976.1 C->U-editing enzyme APOBEC-2-like [Denticeps clupeoides]